VAGRLFWFLPATRRIKACWIGTETKKPTTNNIVPATSEASTNIAVRRRRSPASIEPVARAMPAGTAKKARMATVLMSAVVAEQIRK
jgi:hypothetical protein